MGRLHPRSGPIRDLIKDLLIRSVNWTAVDGDYVGNREGVCVVGEVETKSSALGVSLESISLLINNERIFSIFGC
jgi:hypothetical protein